MQFGGNLGATLGGCKAKCFLTNGQWNAKVDQDEVWSAIRYLDPDERDKDREAESTTTIIAVTGVLLTVCAVWVVLWLRVRGL
jgi:hypothetical protein